MSALDGWLRGMRYLSWLAVAHHTLAEWQRTAGTFRRPPYAVPFEAEGCATGTDSTRVHVPMRAVLTPTDALVGTVSPRTPERQRRTRCARSTRGRMEGSRMTINGVSILLTVCALTIILGFILLATGVTGLRKQPSQRTRLALVGCLFITVGFVTSRYVQ